MNDLYGVDPAAPSGEVELISLLRLFGPTEGRFIYAFPDNWIGRVRVALEGLPQGQQNRALAWLERQRRHLPSTNHRFLDNRSWAENALALRAEVAGLIGPRSCPATLIPIDEILVNPDRLPDARGKHLPRTVTAYIQAVTPLLRASSKVVLVDPYFRLHAIDQAGRAVVARQRKVLVAMLAEALRLRKVSNFVLFTNRKEALAVHNSEAAFAEELASTMAEVRGSAATSQLELEYDFLDERPDPKQHARYLLGNGCGIQFDHGFDTSNDATRNHVHWMAPAELDPLLARFDVPGH